MTQNPNLLASIPVSCRLPAVVTAAAIVLSGCTGGKEPAPAAERPVPVSDQDAAAYDAAVQPFAQELAPYIMGKITQYEGELIPFEDSENARRVEQFEDLIAYVLMTHVDEERKTYGAVAQVTATPEYPYGDPETVRSINLFTYDNCRERSVGEPQIQIAPEFEQHEEIQTLAMTPEGTAVQAMMTGEQIPLYECEFDRGILLIDESVPDGINPVTGEPLTGEHWQAYVNRPESHELQAAESPEQAGQFAAESIDFAMQILSKEVPERYQVQPQTS